MIDPDQRRGTLEEVNQNEDHQKSLRWRRFVEVKQWQDDKSYLASSEIGEKVCVCKSYLKRTFLEQVSELVELQHTDIVIFPGRCWIWENVSLSSSPASGGIHSQCDPHKGTWWWRRMAGPPHLPESPGSWKMTCLSEKQYAWITNTSENQYVTKCWATKFCPSKIGWHYIVIAVPWIPW